MDINKYETVKKYSKKVLGHGAAEKLRKLTLRNLYVNTVVEDRVNVPEAPHHRITEHAFDKLLTAFIKLYCTSTDPKGDVITYLQSANARKPKETSVLDHQDRMEEIMRYSMFLEGARNNLSEDEMKTIIFNSFPDQWQINY